ncbi:MAG: tRNA (cytidine(34)-2'-O)-methyltransferase [Tissierellia bacterium]|nr:tRNA (cytidine(34)-2'-O)-methyltransferase [Tissierellia bacterium]
MINIVLYQPEIAANTGNVGRTCYLTNTRLHLIRPFGFVLNDKNLRRVGLDYWKDVDLVIHDSFEDFVKYVGDSTVYIATTKAEKFYTDVEYKDGDYILFGRESSGVDPDVTEKFGVNNIKIQMRLDTDRSLNVANSANIILYEALRQTDFNTLK